MIYHKWEYGREHDWLAVDKNGYVGYFISGHLNVLPHSVLIPWEYLHNLLYMWIASACRYAIKKYYINCSSLRHWI